MNLTHVPIPAVCNHHATNKIICFSELETELCEPPMKCVDGQIKGACFFIDDGSMKLSFILVQSLQLMSRYSRGLNVRWALRALSPCSRIISVYKNKMGYFSAIRLIMNLQTRLRFLKKTRTNVSINTERKRKA